MKIQKLWRTIAFILSLGIIVWFVYSNRKDLMNLPQLLSQIDLKNIAYLILLETLFLLALAQSNRLIFHSLDVNSKLIDQLKLLFAASTIEKLFPSAGAASMSSFVWLSKLKGIPVFKTVQMTGTSFILGYVQILPLLFIPSFLFKSSKSEVKYLTAISIGIVFLFMGFLAVVGNREFSRKINSLSLLSHFPRLKTILNTSHDYLNWCWENKIHLLPPLFLLWFLYPIRVFMLWVCFMAFHFLVSWKVIWTGYSISIILSFLSFLPTTLGVFEMSMIGTFTMLGVPGGISTAVTFLYRAITYWVPIPFGLLSYWDIKKNN